MKLGKYLVSIVLVSFFMIGTVEAKVQPETLKESCTKENLSCDHKEKDTSKLPNIYVFRGDGCGYCKKLVQYLDTIYDEISDKVNIVVYEVGRNEENWALYQKVGAKFGDEVRGYPYLVIGKYVFDGYASSYDKEIEQAIANYAAESEPYDVVAEVINENYSEIEKESVEVEAKKESNSGAVIAFIFGIVVVVGLFTAYQIKK